MEERGEDKEKSEVFLARSCLEAQSTLATVDGTDAR